MQLRNMSLPAFINYVQDKNLYCIGAGKGLKDLSTYAYLGINVKLIFDNDVTKQNNGVNYCNRKYNVKSVSLLPRLINNDKPVVLITASMASVGMVLYEQLKQMDGLEEVECFFWSYIFADTRSIIPVKKKLGYRIADEPLIPKVIHYCWFGGGGIPEWQKELIDGWRKKCPDYEIVRWDESNYDVKKSEYIKKAYNLGKWAFVSDYARKDIIYQYGGIYLDVDVEIIKSLNELLYQKGFFGTQIDRRVASGLGFGAVPKLDVIRELRDIYNNEEFLYTNSSKIKIAPDYETDILIAHGYNMDGRLQRVAQLTIYPPEVLSGTLAYSNSKYITENTFSIHHYAGSWTNLGKARRPSRAMKLYEEVVNAEKIVN